jgi:DNA-binding NtrC family response regulator
LPLIKKGRPDLPVLLMTAFGDALTLGEACRNGAAGFIAKPFRIKDVLSAVSRVLFGKAG